MAAADDFPDLELLSCSFDPDGIDRILGTIGEDGRDTNNNRVAQVERQSYSLDQTEHVDSDAEGSESQPTGSQVDEEAEEEEVKLLYNQKDNEMLLCGVYLYNKKKVNLLVTPLKNRADGSSVRKPISGI